MLSGNPGALILSFLYVFAIVGIAELIRSRAGYSVDFTRKVVHVGVGVWVVPTLLLFDSWTWAIIPPATFVILNTLSYRFKLVGSMEEGGSNLGTILFPLAFILMLAVFWPRGRPDVIAGGILVLALGDAAAAIVGRKFGRIRYRVGSGHRSVEGSLAMFGFSLLALGLATRVLFPVDIAPLALVGVAALATGLEAASQFGTDNLLVPMGTGIALYVLASTPIP